MGVRNCKELGTNLQKIITRLMANDNLVKLLWYGDADPLSKAALTKEEKTQNIFNKLIKIVPKVTNIEEEHSIVSIRVINGRTLTSNNEFETITIGVEVYIPWEQWLIKDSNLRPFAILGEIQSSLKNKTVDGLGKMTGGDFDLNYVTAELACYEAIYTIVSYD